MSSTSSTRRTSHVTRRVAATRASPPAEQPLPDRTRREPASRTRSPDLGVARGMVAHGRSTSSADGHANVGPDGAVAPRRRTMRGDHAGENRASQEGLVVSTAHCRSPWTSYPISSSATLFRSACVTCPSSKRNTLSPSISPTAGMCSSWVASQRQDDRVANDRRIAGALLRAVRVPPLRHRLRLRRVGPSGFAAALRDGGHPGRHRTWVAPAEPTHGRGPSSTGGAAAGRLLLGSRATRRLQLGRTPAVDGPARRRVGWLPDCIRRSGRRPPRGHDAAATPGLRGRFADRLDRRSLCSDGPNQLAAAACPAHERPPDYALAGLLRVQFRMPFRRAGDFSSPDPWKHRSRCSLQTAQDPLRQRPYLLSRVLMGLHRRGPRRSASSPCRPMSASSKLQRPFSVRPPRRTRCGLSWASAEMRRVLLASTFDATGPRSSLPAHRAVVGRHSWRPWRRGSVSAMSPSRRWHHGGRDCETWQVSRECWRCRMGATWTHFATQPKPVPVPSCWLTTRRCCSTHPRNMSCSRCSSMPKRSAAGTRHRRRD